MCDQNERLEVALRLTEDLPIEYQQDYKRWQGEPVKAIIIPQSLFRLNASGHPTLLKHHQQFILSLAHLNPFVIIEMTSAQFYDDELNGSIRYFQKYIKNRLWPSQKEIDSVQRYAKGFEDTLQSPLQPLMHHLESSTYEVFEKDPIKYEQY